MNFSFSKLKKLYPKYDPKIFFHDDYNYNAWHEELNI